MKKFATLLIAFTLGICAFNVIPLAYAEPQPHMTAALNLLRDAREQLSKASSDKGSHRGEAIRLIDDAIREVKDGIEYDNRHISPSEDYRRPRGRY
ncbi:conserved hypothetical protein [Gammaproteobacteria bacterium]